MKEVRHHYHQIIFETIKQIPLGKVATYRYIGEIAEKRLNMQFPNAAIEVAHVVNAHESEYSFQRVIYTYLSFRNDRQKKLLVEEKAIDIENRCANYWKSPLETEEELQKVNRATISRDPFSCLQEYYYFMHENHPLAFTINSRKDRKPMGQNNCLCLKCSSLNQ